MLPALTAAQLNSPAAALQQPPTQLLSLLLEYKPLPTPPPSLALSADTAAAISDERSAGNGRTSTVEHDQPEGKEGVSSDDSSVDQASSSHGSTSDAVIDRADSSVVTFTSNGSYGSTATPADSNAAAAASQADVSVAGISDSYNNSSVSDKHKRRLLQASGPIRHDLLVLFTQAAAAAAFNEDYVRSAIQNMVAFTNKVRRRTQPLAVAAIFLCSSWCACWFGLHSCEPLR